MNIDPSIAAIVERVKTSLDAVFNFMQHALHEFNDDELTPLHPCSLHMFLTEEANSAEPDVLLASATNVRCCLERVKAIGHVIFRILCKKNGNPVSVMRFVPVSTLRHFLKLYYPRLNEKEMNAMIANEHVGYVMKKDLEEQLLCENNPDLVTMSDVIKNWWAWCMGSQLRREGVCNQGLCHVSSMSVMESLTTSGQLDSNERDVHHAILEVLMRDAEGKMLTQKTKMTEHAGVAITVLVRFLLNEMFMTLVHHKYHYTPDVSTSTESTSTDGESVHKQEKKKRDRMMISGKSLMVAIGLDEELSELFDSASCLGEDVQQLYMNHEWMNL